MRTSTKFTSHDEYIASMPSDIQKILRKVQALVEAALPSAQRCISYNMPAYRIGKVFFYFAGFKHHLGIYPPVRKDKKLISELAPYSNEKGNLAFQYKAPIPYELIGRVAVTLAREYESTAPAKQAMTVERIYISPARGAAQVACEHITLQRGMGIVGDRHFGVRKHPGQNLTLVEAEEIERFCAQHGRPLDLGMTRRNLVTRGVRLNDLVNAEFTIGGVRVRGVELCEPCVVVGRLLRSESLSQAAVVKQWVGRAGLRVDVLDDGEIVRGAAVAVPA